MDNGDKIYFGRMPWESLKYEDFLMFSTPPSLRVFFDDSTKSIKEGNKMSKKTEDKPKLSLKSLDKKIDDIQLDLDKGDGIWQENLDSIHKGQRELHKRLHILELYRPKLYIEEEPEEDADDKHAREQLVTFYKGIAYTALSIFVGFAIGWFCK